MSTYCHALITGTKGDSDGTQVRVFIPDPFLSEQLSKKEIRYCELRLDDGRNISAEQRRKAYATIRDLAEHTGYLPEEMKEWLKYEHMIRTGCGYFSLSSCSMDTARGFINTILDMALELGAQLKDPGYKRTDDIGHYVWACLKTKKCAVCGKKACLHHWTHVGLGYNRKKINHIGMLAEPLCWEHHTECHSMAQGEFDEKYHLEPVKIDEEIAKIWDLPHYTEQDIDGIEG